MSDDLKLGKTTKVNIYETESVTVECPFGHRWDLSEVYEIQNWGSQSCPECKTMARWLVVVNNYNNKEEVA